MTTTNKVKVVCPRCSQHFSITLPQPEISNNLRTSVVAVGHPELSRCSNNKCRQPFVLMIEGVQLSFNAQAVGEDIVQQLEGTSIIKPSLELIG